MHIAPAAKAAGARVFIPREFRWPTEHLNDKQLGLKGALHAKLREVGPPLLLVFTGAFSDSLWNEYGVFFVPVSFVSVWLIRVRENNSYVNLNVKAGKVAVGGNGDSLISFTTAPMPRASSYMSSFTPPRRGYRTRPCVSKVTARYLYYIECTPDHPPGLVTARVTGA